MFKNYIKFLFYTIILFQLCSCQSQHKDLGNIFHKGNGAEPQTLDPHKAEGVPASNILRDLYEGLVEVSPSGEPTLAAAKSYEITNNGKTYTFQLRKNKWSNGDRVTAQDFEYGLKRSIDPETGSKYSLILSPILNAMDIINGKKDVSELGVTALSDDVLQIQLESPTPYFFDLLNHSTTYPAHASSIKAHGSEFTKPGNHITNGAYTLQEWVIQSHITLKRNSQYWNDKNTAIDAVVYHAIDTSASELKKYRAGELDFTSGIPLSQVDWVKNNLTDELHISPYLGCYYYGFNVTKKPFKNNPDLRLALSLAIDRSVITTQIAKFGEIPAYSFVPPGVNNYQSKELFFAKLSREEQINLARNYYKKAGYSLNNPLSVEIRYNTLDGHKKIAIAISAMWKEVLGARTTIVNEEWKVFLETRKQKQKTEVFRAGWIGDYNDAFTFLELLHSQHGINDSGYMSPAYDNLLKQASNETIPETRKRILQRAEELLMLDHPIMPIYFYTSKRVVKPRVKGFEPNIVDRYYTKNLSLALNTNKK